MRSVCVTVAAARGSTPREAGARMLVSDTCVDGSIGGGHLEFRAITTARDLLAVWRKASPPPGAEHRETHALGPALGQCCGGSVDLLYTPGDATTLPAPKPLFFLQLHGAGHVGRALVRVLRTLPCTVQWIDERDDAFPPPDPLETSGPARISRLAVDGPQDEVSTAPPGAFYLVMTHSHDLDFAIGEAILRRGDFGFLGLIGSKTKRARFVHRFERRGIAAATIARMTCPIGVEGIAGKEPEVLALAAVAQLLQAASRRESVAGAAALAAA